MKRHHVTAMALSAGWTAMLAACGTYDPLDQFCVLKNFDPTYKAAYEANKNAPHVYDRAPTPSERNEVHQACQAYVQQQLMALVGNTVGGLVAPKTSSTVVPPSVERCESQHFNLAAHNAAVELHNATSGNTVPPY